MAIKKFITLIVFLCAIIVTLLGMLENIRPYFSKPADRHYTGLQGFVDDYIGYVSYVKEGMYGRNTFRIRSLSPPQTSTSAQLIYIAMGKAGNMLHFSAPFAYHFFRAVFGICFFLSIYFLLSKSFSSVLAMITTILTATVGQVGWYIYQNNFWMYKTIASFGFTDNSALRFASRPHYLVGAFLFCAISFVLLSGKNTKKNNIIIFFLSLALGTIHPSFGVILGFTATAMSILTILHVKKLNTLCSLYTACLAGLFVGLLASYWSTHQYPYTSILAFESYVLYEKLSLDTILGDSISFGPTFWIGFPTLFVLSIKNRFKNKIDLYMCLWLCVQMLLFFVFYKYFRSERVRYIQSLYFIPMTYGTVRLFQLITQKNKMLLYALLFLLFLVGFPGYLQGIQTSMNYHTNYQTYSNFIFPTRYIMEAYTWLDKNTPTESIVLASWEAANNIILYSHNYVIGNKQGWPADTGNQMERAKDAFFTGTFSQQQAHEFIKQYNIHYVYNGYQESDEFLKFGLTKEIYQNPEVTIYKIL